MGLLTLTSEQKAQARNAFTLIDSESKDGKISQADIINVHKTFGFEVPSQSTLDAMLAGNELISFAQYSQILAEELSKLDDRTTLANALKVFATEDSKDDLIIDLEELKEACCSVQLGEIGSGDHRLSRDAFDSLTKSFVKENLDGKRMFYASNWLEAYIE